MLQSATLLLVLVCSKVNAFSSEVFHSSQGLVGQQYRISSPSLHRRQSQTHRICPTTTATSLQAKKTTLKENEFTVTPVPQNADWRQPRSMDAAIFNFNKKVIDTVYDIICLIYPVKGNDRDFARFFVLATVARVPYFAYLSVMHLRETFGERELGEKMRTHYAEADNELHHLLIMESLGKYEQNCDRESENDLCDNWLRPCTHHDRHLTNFFFAHSYY